MIGVPARLVAPQLRRLGDAPRRDVALRRGEQERLALLVRGEPHDLRVLLEQRLARERRRGVAGEEGQKEGEKEGEHGSLHARGCVRISYTRSEDATSYP